MKRVDLVFGLALLVVGALYLFEAVKLPLSAGKTTGAGYFPMILGVSMIALSALLIARAAAARSGGVGGEEGLVPGRGELRKLTLVVGLLFLYCLVLELLGFMVSTFLFVSSLLAGLQPDEKRSALAIGAVVAIVSYGVFGLLLQVQLPRGPLG